MSAQQTFEFWQMRAVQFADDVVLANDQGDYDEAQVLRLCRDSAMSNMIFWLGKIS
jgi:hypothetical protein